MSFEASACPVRGRGKHWGQVAIVDGVQMDDGDSWDFYGCEAHAEAYAEGGAYIPPPSDCLDVRTDEEEEAREGQNPPSPSGGAA